MPRKTIYEELAESIDEGDSQIIPKLFEMLADENEARVLMAASPAASAPELAAKTGLPVEDIERLTGPLFNKGLLYRSSRTDEGGNRRYYRVRALLQFHDATVLSPDAADGLFALWREYQEKEYPAYLQRFESTLTKSRLRVIPVNIALEPGTQIAPFEDVKQIVSDAQTLAVVKCPCRLVAGSPCGKPLETCIQVDKAADYTLERGSGRKIDEAEAIDLLRACEEEGLVHMVSNKRGLGNIICNCCEDCCIAWPGPKTSAAHYAAPSRFAAVVDPDACTGCGDCLDRCIFDAVAVGDTAQVNGENCMGCGQCAVVCPADAISLVESRDEAFIPE